MSLTQDDILYHLDHLESPSEVVYFVFQHIFKYPDQDIPSCPRRTIHAWTVFQGMFTRLRHWFSQEDISRLEICLHTSYPYVVGITASPVSARDALLERMGRMNQLATETDTDTKNETH